MSLYVRGDTELIAKLGTLRDKTIKAAIRKGTREGSKQLAAVVKAEAPVHTGAYKQAVKVRSLPRKKNTTGTRVTVQVPHAGLVEWGHHAKNGVFVFGRHPLRHAVDRQGRNSLHTALDIIRDEIKRA